MNDPEIAALKQNIRFAIADQTSVKDTYQIPRGAVSASFARIGREDRAEWTKDGLPTDIFEMLDSHGRFSLCELESGKIYIVIDVISADRNAAEYQCYLRTAELV